MKTFLITLLLMSSGAQAAPILSESEQDDLLQSIDNICGDTWCEGDSNWSFDAMRCDSEKGCVLDLTMKPYDFEEDQALSSRPFQCQLPGFTDKSSLVEITSRGLQYTQALYEAVSDCINKLSDDFGPIYVPVDTSCESLFSPKTAAFTYATAKEVKASGVYGAIEAVSQIVRQESQSNASCELIRAPYYRDSASCETTKDQGEACLLPSLKGFYFVTLDHHGAAQVSYLPTPSRPSQGQETRSDSVQAER